MGLSKIIAAEPLPRIPDIVTDPEMLRYYRDLEQYLRRLSSFFRGDFISSTVRDEVPLEGLPELPNTTDDWSLVFDHLTGALRWAHIADWWEVTPVVDENSIIPFGGGREFGAGVYVVEYIEGALQYISGTSPAEWQINQRDDSAGYYRILYRSGGSDVDIKAPGGFAIYTSQALAEAAQKGASQEITHGGDGAIKIEFNDLSSYSNNVAGSPNPTFRLRRKDPA